jgi:hypothetical protein
MSEEKLEEFKVTFKNGALENLERLAKRFDADGDLEKVVAKAVKLLTFVHDAKDGKVIWEKEAGVRYFVEIDKL